MFPEEASEASVSGEYIPEHANHWQIEPFIPIPAADLASYLLSQLHDPRLADKFQDACQVVDRDIHSRSLPQYQRLDAAYTALDPDRDTSLLVPRDDEELRREADEVALLMRTALEAADYSELTHEQLAAATKITSFWGVPLHVDFDIFEHLAVFARGDVIGVRELRRWKNLYRKELVDVQIYRRIVVFFKVLPNEPIEGEGESDRFYLRMFKNIPQADVDMLIPNSRIRISWIDRTKILVPSLGGISMTLWKLVRIVLLVAVITTGKIFVVLGLLGATLGYVIRSISSYFQTKKNYELNLTRSLYFQKLDSNAGVIYRILDEARRQDYREAILAYYVVLTELPGVSRRRVCRRAERILREAINVEVSFEIDKAIDTLRHCGLVCAVGDQIELT